jgi:hypothetical protein
MLRDFFTPAILDYNIIEKKVVIAIQFKEDPDQPERLVNFNFLKNHYEQTFPNWKIIFGYGDDKSGNFNYGISANKNLHSAFAEHDADICYLTDADTLVSTDALIEAISYSINTGEYSVPYTYVIETDREKTEKIFKNEKPQIDEKSLIPVCREIIDGKYYLIPSGGCNVIPRKIYEDGLRFEERYDGYAPHDVAMHKDYLDKYKKLFYFTEGIMYSIWNKRSFDSKKFKYNNDILKNYHDVDFNSSWPNPKSDFLKI